MPTLNDLYADYNLKSEAAQKIYDVDEPTADQMDEAKRLNHEIEDLVTAIDAAKTKQAEWADGRKTAQERAAANRTPVYGTPFPDEGSQDPARAKLAASIADRVLADPGFKQFLAGIKRGEGVTGARFGHSPRVEFEGMGLKTLITGLSDTSGGAFVTTDRKPLFDLPFRPFTIRDIITIGQTGSDTVDYPYIVSRTNAAAPVAEATGTADGTGGKPESGVVLGVATASVKTIAHWVPASRRALADAPQIRTIINSLLLNGLEEEWEDQVIAGSGVGENVTGLLNYTGTTAQAFDSDLLITMRKARTKVRTTGRGIPTAYIMNPLDWQTLDLLKDNEARYYFGGPLQLGTPRLWGLPVIESEAMTQGTAMVGDFRQVVWWDRMQTQILVSDSHSDFFIRNLVAFLAELRGALTVWNPAALVEVALS